MPGAQLKFSASGRKDFSMADDSIPMMWRFGSKGIFHEVVYFWARLAVWDTRKVLRFSLIHFTSV